jgi:hypothetical protein
VLPLTYVMAASGESALNSKLEEHPHSTREAYIAFDTIGMDGKIRFERSLYIGLPWHREEYTHPSLVLLNRN